MAKRMPKRGDKYANRDALEAELVVALLEGADDGEARYEWGAILSIDGSQMARLRPLGTALGADLHDREDYAAIVGDAHLQRMGFCPQPK